MMEEMRSRDEEYSMVDRIYWWRNVGCGYLGNGFIPVLQLVMPTGHSH